MSRQRRARIGEEQSPLLIRGKLGGDGLEGVVHFIERSVEPRDREVAGNARATPKHSRQWRTTSASLSSVQ
jgi:hypothetical protein